MKKIRLVSALLLAVPLLLFGLNWFLQFFDVPIQGDSEGVRWLAMTREGGLMTWISLSHVAIGAMLLVPRTRFLGALMQLPISLGIVAFHATMLPEGLGPGVVLLVLNLGVLAHRSAFARLLARST
jgi:putative oxidoreductase